MVTHEVWLKHAELEQRRVRKQTSEGGEWVEKSRKASELREDDSVTHITDVGKKSASNLIAAQLTSCGTATLPPIACPT
jgi:hypothetical protein